MKDQKTSPEELNKLIKAIPVCKDGQEKIAKLIEGLGFKVDPQDLKLKVFPGDRFRVISSGKYIRVVGLPDYKMSLVGESTWISWNTKVATRGDTFDKLTPYTQDYTKVTE